MVRQMIPPLFGPWPAPESKKIMITMYATPRQRALLKILRKVTRVPEAEFIREGIDMVLARGDQ